MANPILCAAIILGSLTSPSARPPWISPAEDVQQPAYYLQTAQGIFADRIIEFFLTEALKVPGKQDLGYNASQFRRRYHYHTEVIDGARQFVIDGTRFFSNGQINRNISEVKFQLNLGANDSATINNQTGEMNLKGDIAYYFTNLIANNSDIAPKLQKIRRPFFANDPSAYIKGNFVDEYTLKLGAITIRGTTRYQDHENIKSDSTFRIETTPPRPLYP